MLCVAVLRGQSALEFDSADALLEAVWICSDRSEYVALTTNTARCTTLPHCANPHRSLYLSLSLRTSLFSADKLHLLVTSQCLC